MRTQAGLPSEICIRFAQSVQRLSIGAAILILQPRRRQGTDATRKDPGPWEQGVTGAAESETAPIFNRKGFRHRFYSGSGRPWHPDSRSPDVGRLLRA